MFLVFLVFICLVVVVLTGFFVLNIVTAIMAALGLLLALGQVALGNKNGLTWLIALTLLLGGSGALGGAWELYNAVDARWPDLGWSEISWVAGYISGGVAGVLLGFSIILKWKGASVERNWRFFQDFIASLRSEWSELLR